MDQFKAVRINEVKELFRAELKAEIIRTIKMIEFLAIEFRRIGGVPGDEQYFSDVLGLVEQLLSVSEHINLRKEILDTFSEMVRRATVQRWQQFDQ